MDKELLLASAVHDRNRLGRLSCGCDGAASSRATWSSRSFPLSLSTNNLRGMPPEWSIAVQLGWIVEIFGLSQPLKVRCRQYLTLQTSVGYNDVAST